MFTAFEFFNSGHVRMELDMDLGVALYVGAEPRRWVRVLDVLDSGLSIQAYLLMAAGLLADTVPGVVQGLTVEQRELLCYWAFNGAGPRSVAAGGEWRNVRISGRDYHTYQGLALCFGAGNRPGLVVRRLLETEAAARTRRVRG